MPAALAESLGRLGSVQSFLSQTGNALASYRSQAAVLKDFCDRFPLDPAGHHELMLAYSHVGDIMGNPEYENAGDSGGAFQAYTQMVEQARFLYEADKADMRALSDYGIAPLRLGLVTPLAGPQKRKTLEQSEELLSRAAAGNPRGGVIAAYKSRVESELPQLESVLSRQT